MNESWTLSSISRIFSMQAEYWLKKMTENPNQENESISITFPAFGLYMLMNALKSEEKYLFYWAAVNVAIKPIRLGTDKAVVLVPVTSLHQAADGFPLYAAFKLSAKSFSTDLSANGDIILPQWINIIGNIQLTCLSDNLESVKGNEFIMNMVLKYIKIKMSRDIYQRNGFNVSNKFQHITDICISTIENGLKNTKVNFFCEKVAMILKQSNTIFMNVNLFAKIADQINFRFQKMCCLFLAEKMHLNSLCTVSSVPENVQIVLFGQRSGLYIQKPCLLDLLEVLEKLLDQEMTASKCLVSKMAIEHLHGLVHQKQFGFTEKDVIYYQLSEEVLSSKPNIKKITLDSRMRINEGSKDNKHFYELLSTWLRGSRDMKWSILLETLCQLKNKCDYDMMIKREESSDLDIFALQLVSSAEAGSIQSKSGSTLGLQNKLRSFMNQSAPFIKESKEEEEPQSVFSRTLACEDIDVVLHFENGAIRSGRSIEGRGDRCIRGILRTPPKSNISIYVEHQKSIICNFIDCSCEVVIDGIPETCLGKRSDPDDECSQLVFDEALYQLSSPIPDGESLGYCHANTSSVSSEIIYENCSIGNEDLILPEMTCIKLSFNLNLTVQHWSKVLCYLGKAKHLEDLTFKLRCFSEISTYDKYKCDSVERSLRENSSLKTVKLEMHSYCPKELTRSCLIGVLHNQTMTDVNIYASYYTQFEMCLVTCESSHIKSLELKDVTLEYLVTVLKFSKRNQTLSKLLYHETKVVASNNQIQSMYQPLEDLLKCHLTLKQFHLKFHYPSGLFRPCLLVSLSNQTLEELNFEAYGTAVYSLDQPDQCLLSHVPSLTLELAPLHCTEVLCYLAKGNLESIQVSLRCPEETSSCDECKCDSVERSLRENSSLKTVKLEMHSSCPKELTRSCLIDVLHNQAMTDVNIYASCFNENCCEKMEEMELNLIYIAGNKSKLKPENSDKEQKLSQDGATRPSSSIQPENSDKEQKLSQDGATRHSSSIQPENFDKEQKLSQDGATRPSSSIQPENSDKEQKLSQDVATRPSSSIQPENSDKEQKLSQDGATRHSSSIQPENSDKEQNLSQDGATRHSSSSQPENSDKEQNLSQDGATRPSSSIQPENSDKEQNLSQDGATRHSSSIQPENSDKEQNLSQDGATRHSSSIQPENSDKEQNLSQDGATRPSSSIQPENSDKEQKLSQDVATRPSSSIQPIEWENERFDANLKLFCNGKVFPIDKEDLDDKTISSIFNPFDCNVPVSTSVEQEKESKQCDFDGDCSNSFIDKISETCLGKRSDPDGECSQLVFDEALYQLSSPILDGESLGYIHVNTSSNSNEFSQESDSGDPKLDYDSFLKQQLFREKSQKAQMAGHPPCTINIVHGSFVMESVPLYEREDVCLLSAGTESCLPALEENIISEEHESVPFNKEKSAFVGPATWSKQLLLTVKGEVEICSCRSDMLDGLIFPSSNKQLSVDSISDGAPLQVSHRALPSDYRQLRREYSRLIPYTPFQLYRKIHLLCIGEEYNKLQQSYSLESVQELKARTLNLKEKVPQDGGSVVEYVVDFESNQVYLTNGKCVERPEKKKQKLSQDGATRPSSSIQPIEWENGRFDANSKLFCNGRVFPIDKEDLDDRTILSIFNPFDCNVPVSTSVEQEKESKQCDFDGDCSNSFIDKMSETGLGKRSDPDGECSQLVFDEALYQLSSPIPDGESLEYCHVNTSSNSNEFSQESDSGDPKLNYDTFLKQQLFREKSQKDQKIGHPLGKRSDPDGECSQLVFDEALYQLSSPIPDGESLGYCHVNTSSNSNELSQESDSDEPKLDYDTFLKQQLFREKSQKAQMAGHPPCTINIVHGSFVMESVPLYEREDVCLLSAGTESCLPALEENIISEEHESVPFNKEKSAFVGPATWSKQLLLTVKGEVEICSCRSDMLDGLIFPSSNKELSVDTTSDGAPLQVSHRALPSDYGEEYNKLQQSYSLESVQELKTRTLNLKEIVLQDGGSVVEDMVDFESSQVYLTNGRCVERPEKKKQKLSQDGATRPSSSIQPMHSELEDAIYSKSRINIGERIAPIGQEDVSDTKKVLGPVQSSNVDLSVGKGSKLHSFTMALQRKINPLGRQDDEISPASESTPPMTAVLAFAHKSGDMYGNQPHCISHMTNIPPPNTVHPSEYVNAAQRNAQLDPLSYVVKQSRQCGVKFEVINFIKGLRLEWILVSSVKDTVKYILDRAQLEKMYIHIKLKDKVQVQDFTVALKSSGITSDIANYLNAKFCENPRGAFNDVKDLADQFDIKQLMRNLQLFITNEDHLGVLDELQIVVSKRGSKPVKKSQVVHALFLSNADTAFISDVILQGLVEQLPPLQDIAQIAKPLLSQWDNIWTDIRKSFYFECPNNPLIDLPENGRSEKEVLHCLGVWIAYKSESSTPSVLNELSDILKKVGLHKVITILIPTYEIDEDDGSFIDFSFTNILTSQVVECDHGNNSKTVEATFGQQSFIAKRKSKTRDIVHENLSEKLNKEEQKVLEDVDHGRISQTSDIFQKTNIKSITNMELSEDHRPVRKQDTAHDVPRDAPVGESNQSQPGFFVPISKMNDEDFLIKQPLDPKNPTSVVIHAKAIYLSGDYPRCREVLSILDRQLLLDAEIQRARIFGIAISFYRQKAYKEAYPQFDRLEDIAMQQNASGDVAVASIYRGEMRLALKEYPKAIEMYKQAHTTYDVKNVAHKFGVIIISKSAVILKLANCYKLTSNFRKAKEIFKMAVEHSVQLRKEAEALPISDTKRKDKITQATKDEISTRHALGNLYQGMSDCNNSLEEYKEALRLQETLNDPLALGWAKGNLGNALLGLNRVHEAIPYLKEAFKFAKKYERSLLGIGRAASNLGNALQTVKRYKEANDYFEIAYGHAVFCNDEPAQARALGNLGNIKTLLEENLDALNCYNETLSLNCDEQAKINALQNRAQLYMTLAHKVNENVGEWDEVPSDVVAAEPSESQKLHLPVQESESSQTRHSRLVVSEGKYRTRDGLDNMKDIEDKHSNSDHEVTSAIVPTSTQQSSDSPQEPTFASDQHYLSYRKYYLLKAKNDLEEVMTLIESSFDKVKGGTGSEEDTDSMALSLFEANSRAFYNLQRILVLLGEKQESLKVAEANRARNLGEILWQKRMMSGTVSLMHVNRPLELSSIWEFAQQEKSPVVMLSFTTSCMLVHIIFPGHATESLKKPSLVTNVTSSSSSPSSYTASHTEPKTLIPPQNYHFLKIPLPTDLFTDPTSTEKVKFDQYVSKSLIDYLNQKEFDLFEPITLEEMNTPLNVLFDSLAFKFIEVIESKMSSVRDLVIIPDQTAQLLPWAILQDKSTGVFLGDRYTIRVFPSIFTMGIINSQPPVTITLPSEDRFLVVGNPTIPKVTHNNREISLGRLPHAEAEAVQIAHILEAPPVLKEQATKQTIVYRLQLANIVHIATHGSGTQGYLAFGASIPTLSLKQAVDAKEALLFIEEIQKLQLNASLVVLSACDSGRGQVANEGVNSVARAFLAAGAQSVLVSLLRVPDKSASIFMSFFYRLLAHDGYPTSKAIQKSSMAIRCIQQFSQHVHWGGLQLIGRDISIEYNKTCDTAKVSARVGDPTPFPRLDIMEEMEFALFRQDRLPPRDVVLVKGMSPHDPSEVVRDFVCKNFKHFPGGVFWLNCATDDFLKASLQEIEATIPSLTKLQKDPPEIKETMKKSPKYLESNIGKSFENHFRLYILDHPSNMETVIPLLPDLKHPQTDIIVIGPDDMDTDQSFTKKVDILLLRGCALVNVGHLESYSSIQRMAYSLVRSAEEFSPYRKDIEAFQVISRLCYGCASIVRIFEGMLSDSVDPTIVLRVIAQEVKMAEVIQCSYEVDQYASEPVRNKRKTFPQTLIKKLKSRNSNMQTKMSPLIAAEELRSLTLAERFILSRGYKGQPGSIPTLAKFLEMKLGSLEHFLLQNLSYVSLLLTSQSSQAAFCFPEYFVLCLADGIATSDIEGKHCGYGIMNKLKKLQLVRQYPQPVLSPPEGSPRCDLLYVPDVVQRIATYELDDTDAAFIEACINRVAKQALCVKDYATDHILLLIKGCCGSQGYI